MNETRTLIGVPTNNGQVLSETVRMVLMATKKQSGFAFQSIANSILTNCFNLLWANALVQRDNGVTHFAMVHADVAPENGWLDKMHAIMAKHEADVLSVVLPIKSVHGITSTALDTGPTKWKVQRFTLKQIHEGNATFTHPKLLINTGLMLVDIRKPWVEKVVFRFENDLIFDERGNPEPQAVPEDWYFSRLAKELGAKLFVTREVAAVHYGANIPFPNNAPWGSMAVDEENGEARL